MINGNCNFSNAVSRRLAADYSAECRHQTTWVFRFTIHRDMGLGPGTWMPALEKIDKNPKWIIYHSYHLAKHASGRGQLRSLLRRQKTLK